MPVNDPPACGTLDGKCQPVPTHTVLYRQSWRDAHTAKLGTQCTPPRLPPPDGVRRRKTTSRVGTTRWRWLDTPHHTRCQQLGIVARRAKDLTSEKKIARSLAVFYGPKGAKGVALPCYCFLAPSKLLPGHARALTLAQLSPPPKQPNGWRTYPIVSDETLVPYLRSPVWPRRSSCSCVMWAMPFDACCSVALPS